MCHPEHGLDAPASLAGRAASFGGAGSNSGHNFVRVILPGERPFVGNQSKCNARAISLAATRLLTCSLL